MIVSWLLTERHQLQLWYCVHCNQNYEEVSGTLYVHFASGNVTGSRKRDHFTEFFKIVFLVDKQTFGLKLSYD